MKHVRRFFGLMPFVFLISLFITIQVFAIPPLPSSFYGMVKLNGANVADGTVVQAMIADAVIAEGFTQTWEGSSVFTIDIPGDEPDTASVEGGRSGDTVKFKIGGILAEQSGIWKSGTNTKLDLTVASSEQVAPSKPTPSPVPTQTTIVVIQPTAVPTEAAADPVAQAAGVQASPIPTTVGESLPMAPAAEATPQVVQPNQSSSGGTVQLLPSPANASVTAEAEAGSGGTTTVLILGTVFAGAAALSYVFLSSRRKT